MSKLTFSDLRDVIRRHAQPEYCTAIEGLKVGRTDQPSELYHTMFHTSFGVVAQGVKESMVAGAQFRYAAGHSLLCAADVPVTSRVTDATPSAPYLAMHLEIDLAMVAELLRSRTCFFTKPGDDQVFGFFPLHTDLYDPLVRLVSLLDRPHDIPVMAPLIRREIIWKLLHSEHGVILSQFALGRSHAARIGRATAWIRGNYAETLSIADLASKASMSVPSFHRHFKAVTSMSPLQFQKWVRLQEARRGLASARSISSIAYDVGYESISQFNRDYRRHFNLTPSDDVALYALTRIEALSRNTDT
jgi:AraC-like DNA-binding protein